MVYFFLSVLYLSTGVAWLNDTNHDFGEIEKARPVQHDFTFINTGTDSLYIDNVRTSCGCTDTEWPPRGIATDSTEIIRVHYDSKDNGYFQKKIRVYFRGIRKPSLLTIEGNIIE